MRIDISDNELSTRIRLNYDRLNNSYYDIENVFAGDDADWPGDKEGRALLAFVSHYKICGKKIPCMDLMIDNIPDVTGGKLFFGEKTGDLIFEQQLSGTSWYLRGLCEYYEVFGDPRVLEYLDKTVENIYLPTKGKFSDYPLDRTEVKDGGVGGHSYDVIDNWRLSTDIGCAFMSIDGLSHYYRITKNAIVKELLDEMAEVFDKIDKYKLQAQTHCSLTAARGLVRMYEETSDEAYLEKAKSIFGLYIDKGMTYTYENFNWFGKGDTWTEPCAIIDSLMLAVMLYELTGEDEYRTCAARIYFNGFSSLQRPNGGAGTDSCVSNCTHILKADMYEAYFCCTMRLAEGLWFINEKKDILYAETEGKPHKDSFGRYVDGDIVYAEIPAEFEEYAGKAVYADGLKLFPLIKYYKLKDEDRCLEIRQKVIFK